MHVFIYPASLGLLVSACVLSLQLCPTLCDPMDCSPPDSSVLGDSSGKNTGVGCHALLQGILPTQGSDTGLPHGRRILYHESPGKLRLFRDQLQKPSYTIEANNKKCIMMMLCYLLEPQGRNLLAPRK